MCAVIECGEFADVENSKGLLECHWCGECFPAEEAVIGCNGVEFCSPGCMQDYRTDLEG